MLTLVHTLHLVSGIVWAGGALFFALVVEPALLRLPPDMMRAYLAAAGRYAGPLMSASGVLLLLTGIARTFAGGAIASPADLLQPYGIAVIASFLLVVAVAVSGARHRGAVQRLLAADDSGLVLRLRPLQRRQALVTAGGILATVVIMAMLGLGMI